MLGTEHNVVSGLHLVFGGELFRQCFFLCTDSHDLEDKVLPSDTLAPYWSNFAEAYDEFEKWVEVRSRKNCMCNRGFDCYCLGILGLITQLIHLQSSTCLEIIDNFAGAGHLARCYKSILTVYKSTQVARFC